MRRLTVLASLLITVFVALPSEARASSIAVGSLIHLSDGPGGNGGGEFSADIAPFDGTTDFITFCLQYNEHFYYGEDMWVGGITDHTMGGTPDPISAQTAFLYTGFRNGTLADYAFSGNITFLGNSYDRNATATALQLAFWYLEDEITRDAGGIFRNGGTSFGANALTDFYVSTANAAGWTNIGNVRVLNLYSDHPSADVFTGDLQDQLTLVQNPEPTSISLLGLGLVGLARKLRRRKLQS